jgi:aspartyl protease family protein
MEKANGVYLVPIKVNGLNLNFIFDTGASSISLSSAEAMVMLRQGQITQDDIVGQQQFQDATGEVSVGTIVRLRTVEIGGIVLNNVEASVVDNIQAPLLLGQTALSKFGKVTIDYNRNTIEFN